MNFSPSPAELDAIANSNYHTPFDILGQHLFEKNKKHYIVIRTFVPNANKIELKFGKFQRTMAKIHPAGIFEIVINRKTFFPYKYLISKDDNIWEAEDPYRFGPFFSDYDLHLYAEGNHLDIYEKLGSHLMTINDITGVFFAVWAPNALRVSVIGSFNEWDGRRHVMRHRPSGIWEIFIPGVKEGDLYKYEVKDKSGVPHIKSDPFAFCNELRPKTANIVYDLKGFRWNDQNWMEKRAESKIWEKPLNIYEVHLGSWKKAGSGEDDFLDYRTIADILVPYIKEMGYTHIELLPIAEHPLDASWGYQVTNFYAPTRRFGFPKDFMYLVDKFHKYDIGVILDWVPAHFPKDSHGLAYFDGTYLYEHADPRKGEHKDWGTKVFNFGRNEVSNFLIANAIYWLDYYHIDGLRVDAVASMLYLDYSRENGEWLPNQYGGRENIESIKFIQKFNRIIYERFKGIFTAAEESTSWSGVTHPTYLGGLGFGFKWNMGWMNDILDYMKADPVYRKFKHGILAFSLVYAHSENFILPLSHDEVVHGKRSLLNKMPNDQWQQFANLRLLYTYMFGHPGKKLVFMGGEFGQYIEWAFKFELDWLLLDYDCHIKLKNFVKDLNHLYLEEKSLWELDSKPEGFSWIDFMDNENSVIIFIRYSKYRPDHLIFVCNFTPVVRYDYRFGVPFNVPYKEIFNSDNLKYWGSDVLNKNLLIPARGSWHNLEQNISINLPPLGVSILKPCNE
ncbi:MAG: 1,4-alpha-glucan branching protein GlgB [Candidatus Coatesbacteria bacterium]|nr:1,4-alpha-glucan branching protein GlgB [Candidatus Coatesbacteria bacterium]